jgi:hypothetical protein
VGRDLGGEGRGREGEGGEGRGKGGGGRGKGRREREVRKGVREERESKYLMAVMLGESHGGIIHHQRTK